VTHFDGPWTHRQLAANGARFHVAESGAGPLVLFLHGFPEFWWAWRHQLPALAAAGYRAAAMDLRGYGSSDKTPRGYDPTTLAADVSGVVRTLGARSAVLVGHGWGGYVGWTVAAAHPDCVSALCTLGAPHPARMISRPFPAATRASVSHVIAMQAPWLPERRIRRGGYVARHLGRWSSPASAFPSELEVARYAEALTVWPSPHCALEYHRWLVRSRLRSDGRAFARLMRSPLDLPVLQVVGADDPATNLTAVRRSARHVRGTHDVLLVDAAGHFVQEEQPEVFTSALLSWLARVQPPGGGASPRSSGPPRSSWPPR
jgi:pimeloyl-ACP methyl ester carboxylesterase